MSVNLPAPFPDSYWVIPGRFLAGEYPGSYHLLEARRKLGRLLRGSINAFLDLTMPDELLPYESILHEEAGKYQVEATYRRMPIHDLSIPTIAQMNAILDEIDSLLSNGCNLYLHCWGGIGRTGTVVACYLVRCGLDGAAALQELKRLRSGVPDAWRPSPETDEQCQFVLAWGKGEQKDANEN